MIAMDEQGAGRLLTRESEGRGDLLPARHPDEAIIPVDVLEVEHQMRRVRFAIEA